MTLRNLILAVVAGAFTYSGFSQNLEDVLGFPSKSYSGGGTTTAFARVDSASQSVEANYSMVGDTVLTITMTAPKGKLLQCTTPGGFENYFFYLGVSTDAQNDVGSLPVSIEANFIRPGGDVPGLSTIASYLSTNPGGFAFETSSEISPGQEFTFKGFRFVVQVPAGYDLDFTNSFDAASVGIAESSMVVPDPGQWVSLIDDPLIGVLTARIAALRIKLAKAKRKGKKKLVKRYSAQLRAVNRQLSLL